MRSFHVASGWLATFLSGVTLAACGTLKSEPSTDPCTELTLICPYCTSAADQQHCADAIKSADEAQCTAILDEPSVQTGCIPRDGGSDAKAPEAGPLPDCGATAIADGGCACSGSSCAPSCPSGGCAFTCTSGICSPSCAGGHCTLHCEPGATCEGSCAGGDCVFDCKGGSTCANACPGGGCAFQCEVNAICNDTCGTAAPCVGF